ncbi:prepilin peptidase [Neisseriaceae bacterium JH1-16]|nr:prepilin peptidase [Neisseriaceae bacterium JH1-16]
MSGLTVGTQACFFVFLAAVAAFDALQRRVPNGLILAGMFFALVILLFGGRLGGVGWASSLLGLTVGLLAFLPFFFFGLMGAGDVKFFSIIGLWLGASALLAVWMMASIMAGLQALLWLALSISFGKERSWISIRMHAWRLNKIPYASYLAVSAGLTVYYPSVFEKLYAGVSHF